MAECFTQYFSVSEIVLPLGPAKNIWKRKRFFCTSFVLVSVRKTGLSSKINAAVVVAAIVKLRYLLASVTRPTRSPPARLRTKAARLDQ